MTAFLIFLLKNVLRGRSRVFLTVLAVAVGIAAVVLLYCIGSGGELSALRFLESFGFSGALVVPNEGLSVRSPLLEEDEELISSLSGVEDAIAFTTKYGTISSARDGDDAVIWGVGEGMENFIGFELIHGSFFTPQDIRQGREVCIIDRQTAAKLFGRENAVGLMLSVGIGGVSAELRIAGVTDKGMAALAGLTGGAAPVFVYIPGAVLASITGNDRVAQIAVRTASEDSGKVMRSVIRALKGKYADNVGYTVQDLDGYMRDVGGMMELLKMLLIAAAAVSLLVSGIGVMNAMLSSVKERRQEIGLCLAVGASPRQIAAGFVMEAALISALGGVVGGVFGLIISYLGAMILGIPFVFSLRAALIAEACVICIGILFGTLPAVRAARLCPAEILRDE